MKNWLPLSVIALVVIGAGIFYSLNNQKKSLPENQGLGYTTNETADRYATPSASPEPTSTETASITATPVAKTKKMNKPSMTIDIKKTYQALMHTTAGDMTIDLNASATPIAVNNFVTLARAKFYDGVIFHRVIEGFMIQGGDPEGTGAGGPGYQFDDEKFTGEYTRGTIAMANAGPNTNGSQFFIMHKDYPLPKNYVIFGKVSQGIEIVDKIATAPTTVAFGGEQSKPVTPVKITSVEIIEK